MSNFDFNGRNNIYDKTIVVKGKGLLNSCGLKNVYTYYSSYGLLNRGMRKLSRSLKLHLFSSVCYGDWKKELKKSNLIILFDVGVDNLKAMTRYIKRKNSNIRIIFWYWNPVKKGDDALIDGDIDEIWTYSRFDAKKYGLKYNPQFYYRVLDQFDSAAKTDLIFLGRDKGRRSIVADLVKNAKECGLKCNITLLTTKDNAIKYEEYLEQVFASKCIIDIVPDQNCGLTLRPLEALFYGKKLITNYKDIINYDFYDKENIFLLGKDDIDKISKFVDAPYKEVSRRVIDFYSYEKWLERIEKGEDLKP